jgi:tRNA-2-methylthio-N6-dimethylallyladenosine synthase
MEQLVQVRTKVKDKKNLYIKTFGCQMNEYDSLKLEKILEDSHSLVATPDEADLIIINTCSVRDKPEQKLFSLLGQVKELKKNRENVLIGVGGCVAQQEGEKIIKKSSSVDFVFGTHNLSLVPSLIERRRELDTPQVAVDYRDEWEKLPLGIGTEASPSRISAYVSISRGCNKNCTYCIVPTTRGKEVSRDQTEIEREVKIALRRGAKEIVFLGQTVNSYGRDLVERTTFVKLLDKISTLEGLERIRFTSPHPQEVRKDFIELVTKNPKITRHIHMPLQSGSDRILKMMNRNYRVAKFLSIIDELREKVPDMSITTDIIVGFPGETEEDFLQTLEVMKKVRFQNSYSFIFSKRPGTPAEKMDELISHEEKLARLHELQKLQYELCQNELQTYMGKNVEVLIEGPSSSETDKLQGRNSQNITVNLTKSYENIKPGDLVPVHILSHGKFTLRGEVLEQACLN